METKKLLFLFSILMSMVGTKAWAYDIAVENADGVTIYYNYINDGKELEVTNNGSNYNVGSSYSGSVVIPEEVTYMNITRKVTSIGDEAFHYCRDLTSITIPNSVTSIGEGAFFACIGLTSITIPNSVTSIGDEAFYACSGLTYMIVEEGNPKYDSRDNCNAIIETATNTLIAGCKKSVIPNSVTSIGNWAFVSCSGLTSITIPNSVTSIGQGAFNGCSGLTSVTIPNSVTSIGNHAFAGCIGLTSITIPNSVTSIGDEAFYACSGLTSITIPNSVTSIGTYAFASCSGLTSITIPNSVTSIGEKAFADYDLQEVISKIKNPFVIYKNTFSDNTFSNAKLYIPAGTIDKYKATEGWKKFLFIEEEIEVERTIHVSKAGTLSSYISESQKYKIEKLTLTGEINGDDLRLLREMAGGQINVEYNNYSSTVGALSVLDMSAVKIVAGGEYLHVLSDDWSSYVSLDDALGYSVFQGCEKLTSITIPNSLTSIGNSAFDSCSGLTSITIPNSVTSIGEDAFSGCRGLTSVNISDIAAWCKITFGNSISNPLFYAHHLFLGEEKITDLIIPNSVTSIGYSAFYGCSDLTSITIPNSVTSIGEWAFRDCSGFTSITIPNSVTSIGSYAFLRCSGLTSITIPNSVTSIEGYTFYECSGLTSITIPNSVTSIGEWAFNGCSGLTSVTIPNSVTSIGECAFRGCSGLTSVTIPNSVTSIGNSAFRGCSGLTSVTIPNSVTSIGNSAFSGCSGLTSITIPNSVTSIGKMAFSDYDLSEVISKIENPFDIHINTFSDNTFSNAKLYVPAGTIDKYKATRGWKKFAFIEEETTCINDVQKRVGDQYAYYNLQGQRVDHPSKGLYIKNGRKVLIK